MSEIQVTTPTKTKHEILSTYTFEGKTLTVKQWSREKGINYHTLRVRIQSGESFESAISRPTRKYDENHDRDDRPLEVGMEFGSWTVTELHVKSGYVRCRCKCSTPKLVKINNLRQGNSTYCGKCEHSDNTTHGMSRTRTYSRWHSMLERTKNNKRYVDKGIKVCERWLKFENFLEDMGEIPDDKRVLDRYPNNDGNYEPGNCRWANDLESMRHTSNSRLLTYNGKTQCASAWAEEMKMTPTTLLNRLDRGWDLEEALTTPQGLRRGSGSPEMKDRLIQHKGKEKTATEWAIEFNLHLTTMLERLSRNWSMDRIERTPQGTRGGYSKSAEFNRKLKDQEIAVAGQVRVKSYTPDEARDHLLDVVDGASPLELESILNAISGGNNPIRKVPGQIANRFTVTNQNTTTTTDIPPTTAYNEPAPSTDSTP